MTRALSLACLSLLVVGLLAPRAHAGNRPSVAVLGLEVNDPNGSPTPADAQVARELTDALRSRAKTPTGPYQWQTGSDKDLIDERVLKNCDSETTACMTLIGGDLGADFLIYGSVSKKGGAYDVKLMLFDVTNRQQKNRLSQQIPIAQSQGANIQVQAKQMYNRLTGQGDTGQILVKIGNSGDLRGSIKVDGDEKGTINSSTGTASGIGPGKHTVTVIVGGYKPKEVPVTVVEGQTANVAVELDKQDTTKPDEGEVLPPGPGPGPGPSHDTRRGDGRWKAIAAGAFLVGAAGGVFWVYGSSQIDDANKKLCDLGARPGCPPPAMMAPDAADKINQANSQGDSGQLKTYIGGAASIAGGALMIYAIYKGFVAKSPSEEHAEGHRVHRDRFVVTPVVQPGGGGASVQFDF